MAIEDVIAENQCRRCTAEEFLADQECLCEAVRRWLHFVGQRQTPLRTIAEQFAKQRRVVRCRDNENLANARQHEGGERVIHHRLIVDRQQLFGNHLGHRVEPGTRSAGQNDAFAIHSAAFPYCVTIHLRYSPLVTDCTHS